jgi:AraC family transcriptional regulator of adaptative response/methylated-DNA-[protein]-cysteine methyltransferase
MNAVMTEDEKYAALLRRDAACDGMFFYSVRTTGVFCRPGCAARPPRRENVGFHASIAAAERAGFRACKRCRPADPSQAACRAIAIARACRLIDSAEAAPKLADLAQAAGMSAFHFHRVFKQTTGVTPKAFAAASRAARMRAELSRNGTVTRAIYDAGYNAPSRFYEDAAARLGMTPRAWRAGGAGARIRFAVGACSLGAILVAATEKGVCAIDLGDDPEALLRGLQDRFPCAELVGADAAFERLVAQVVGLVEAPRLGQALPLDIGGTAFQQRVWQALQAIPPGRTVSYAALAASIGAPRSARAVAGACARNVLAVAIPCHRVVRSDGGLSGYRWGVARKRALLAREAE